MAVTEKDRIIWRNVEELLVEKGITKTDLSRLLGVSPQAVNSLKNNGIGVRSIKKLCRALDVDEIRLLTVEAPVRLSKNIPVISWVQAGCYSEVTDIHGVGISGEGEPVQSVRNVGPHAFALRVEGDSMAPRFLPGDIIVVDPDVTCDNGCFCVVNVNGEATFKVFHDRPGVIVLEPLNKKHPDIVIHKDREVDFRIVGKVVDLIPKM